MINNLNMFERSGVKYFKNNLKRYKYLKCMQKFEINPNSLKKLKNIFKIK